MTKEFSLTNARLILDGEVSRGTIHVADNLIVSIDLGETIHTNAIDCGGDFLSPGLIELHTDNLERHRKPRPGVLQPMRDALLAHDGELASTGITTVFDALRIGSVISDGRNAYEPYALEAASTMRRLKEDNHLRIDHQVHLRAEVCSETLAEELEEFGPEQDIGIVSLMDHTPGQRQFRDTAQLILYLKGKYGMSDTDIEQHFTNMRNLQDRHGSAHRKATVAFANAAGAVLASHDDTTIDDVAQSRAVNCRLAEFPTTLEAASECNDAGIAVMMGAPNLMRGKSHSGNVSAAELVSTGDLQILSSDYIPSTLLRAAVKLGIMLDDMAAAMKMVTVTPAQVVGLDDRGRLARGQRADILRFGLEESQPIIRGVWSAGRQVA
ncbi:MAG: alpha-D-ribose 1-methylphosphonate 5-triphosphate diphosphatase [Pseudomonadota bacterium]|nr:alpha-D-ribose 1-methylphosphonate 5-triphosphate diphosphatase [Pseudomonadota bacterium]